MPTVRYLVVLLLLFFDFWPSRGQAFLFAVITSSFTNTSIRELIILLVTTYFTYISFGFPGSNPTPKIQNSAIDFPRSYYRYAVTLLAQAASSKPEIPNLKSTRNRRLELYSEWCFLFVLRRFSEWFPWTHGTTASGRAHSSCCHCTHPPHAFCGKAISGVVPTP
jgi:hypothetical protein